MNLGNESDLRFFPATLMTSLSLGMIIAPKIQIYTELICRSIDPSQSGVTLPFPGIDSLNPSPITILLPVTIPPRLLNTTESLAQPRSMEDPQLFLIKQLDVDVMGRRNDTWFGQCQSSPAVQKDLARLVRRESSRSSFPNLSLIVKTLHRKTGYNFDDDHGSPVSVDDWILG